jgi:hypothetical protein
MKLIILWFLGIFAGPVVAQGSDYVVDINDRKIVGTIKLNTPAINSSMIRFKVNNESSFEQLRPDKIKIWSVGTQVFVSKIYSVDESTTFSVFMKRVSPEKGKVHLYEYYNTSDDMGYTQTFIEKDRKLTEVNYAKFRKQMSLLFEDCKELSQKITDKKFKKKQLLDIIKEYNEWREYLWK